MLRFAAAATAILAVRLLLPDTAAAQSSPCTFRGTITSATTGTAFANNTTQPNCNAFALTWNSTGFTALSIQLEGSDDNSSWTAYSGTTTVLVGSNPSTTLSGAIVVQASSKLAYLRVNVTAVTGTGSINYQVYGYNGVTPAARGGSGGGGGGGIVTQQWTAGTGGLTAGQVACVSQSGTPAKAVECTTSVVLNQIDATVIGIAQTTATAGNPVQIIVQGAATCAFDTVNTPTAGHLAVYSLQANGSCQDSGSFTGTFGVPIIGIVLATGAGTQNIYVVGTGIMGSTITAVAPMKTTNPVSGTNFQIQAGNATSAMGTGTKLAFATGSFTGGDCLQVDPVTGSIMDSSNPCAGGGSSGGGGVTVYSGSTVGYSGTMYFAVGGGASVSATEATVQTASPVAATVSHLTVQLSTALGVGNTAVFTWRDAGVSQSLTCSISGASATSCSDTTHSFSVAIGDLVDIQVVVTGTVAATPNTMIASAIGTTTTSGTVNPGTANQFAWYSATGSAVSGNPDLTDDGTNINVNNRNLQIGSTVLLGNGLQPVSVKAAGAKGDNSTNDTAAIASACATAKLSGAALYFPAGKYLTDTITCINQAGMLIFGDGPLSSIIKSRTGTNVIETTASSIQLVTITNLGIDGNSGTSNHGIYFHNDTFTETVTIRNVKVSGVGGRCIFLPDEFSSTVDLVDCTSANDNGIEVMGSPATIIENSYVHAVGTGKGAYVVYSGNTTLLNDNGVDGTSVNAIWGIFGQSTASGDASNTFSKATLIGCNVEAFNTLGLWIKNGTINLTGVTILAGSSGTAKAILYPGVYQTAVPFIDSNSSIDTLGASWANGIAIHSADNCPLINVGNSFSATLQQCYSDPLSSAYPTVQYSFANFGYLLRGLNINLFGATAAYFTHINGFGAAPTITSGFGTSPTIAGFDSVGAVTVGTGGTATTGIVHWGTSYDPFAIGGIPVVCSVRDKTTTALNAGLTWVETPNQITITATSPFGVGDVLAWQCSSY